MRHRYGLDGEATVEEIEENLKVGNTVKCGLFLYKVYGISRTRGRSQPIALVSLTDESKVLFVDFEDIAEIVDSTVDQEGASRGADRYWELVLANTPVRNEVHGLRMMVNERGEVTHDQDGQPIDAAGPGWDFYNSPEEKAKRGF